MRFALGCQRHRSGSSAARKTDAADMKFSANAYAISKQAGGAHATA
jgi:hypothetical protein